MSKAKYQLLSRTDQTPAMEVNLTAMPQTEEPVSTSLVTNHLHSTVLTEINLNETNVEQTPNETSSYSDNSTINQPQTVLLPPASELPSYNEALRLKKLECNEIPPSYYASVPVDETRITIDAADLRAIAIAEASDSLSLDNEIGSECMFLSAFMIAFFFNWVGFFASICLLPNAAGKYGALSGFGLSMAKWVTIVRYQEWMTNMNDFQQKLFFWLFIFLGFYLFFRGLINFMSLKYRPRSSLSLSRRQREQRWLGFME